MLTSALSNQPQQSFFFTFMSFNSAFHFVFAFQKSLSNPKQEKLKFHNFVLRSITDFEKAKWFYSFHSKIVEMKILRQLYQQISQVAQYVILKTLN
jgi:hypothetical protein